MADLQRLTTSRVSCYLACPKLHCYKYELCRRPRAGSEALSMGSIVHAALEAWWLAWTETNRPADAPLYDMMRAYNDAIASNEDNSIDEYVAGRIMAMLIGYHLRWAGWVVEHAVEVLGAEQKFRAPLVNPATGRPSRIFEIGGMIDLMVRLDGVDMIGEHKTTISDLGIGSTYWERLRMDGQISMYHDGARALGYEPAGCLYDVLRKPGTKPKLATPEESRRYTKGKGCKLCGGSAGGKRGVMKGDGHRAVDSMDRCDACAGSGWKEAPRLHSTQRLVDETPAEYRQRVGDAITAEPELWYGHAEIVRLDSEMEEFRRDLWQLAKNIRAAQLADSWPRNPAACHRYTRECSYYGVCCGSASIDDDDRFESTSQHPELDEPKEG